MGTLLVDKKPLIIINDSGQAELIPMPEFLDKFKTLHFFLEEVVRDWKRASAPYQAEIDEFPPDTISPASAQAFVELQPIFLKCIFSYVMFFVAAETAYDSLYKELDRARQIIGLSIYHPDRPERTETIKKVRKVRNRSIAHIPSARTSRIDALAAISWQPLIWQHHKGEKPDLDDIHFGGTRRVRKSSDGSISEQSEDIKLPGVSKLHKECIDYLEQYDKICADYLEILKEKLDTA